MKVGDLVKLPRLEGNHRAPRTPMRTIQRRVVLFALFERSPDFLAPATDGVYPGFKGWQLELLSSGEPDESW